LNKIFSQIHIVIQIIESDFWLNHPKLNKVTMFEFSALNVGQKYINLTQSHREFQPLIVPETVRLVSFRRNLLYNLFFRLRFLSVVKKGKAVTLNISPAPSASDPVMIAYLHNKSFFLGNI
jgi:hypothetical protein